MVFAFPENGIRRIRLDNSAHVPKFNAERELNEDNPAILRSPLQLRFNNSRRDLEPETIMRDEVSKRERYVPVEFPEVDHGDTVLFETKFSETVEFAKSIQTRDFVPVGP